MRSRKEWKPGSSQRLLLLLSRFSRVRLCATPETAAHQAPLALGACLKAGGMFSQLRLQGRDSNGCQERDMKGGGTRESYIGFSIFSGSFFEFLVNVKETVEKEHWTRDEVFALTVEMTYSSSKRETTI